MSLYKTVNLKGGEIGMDAVSIDYEKEYCAMSAELEQLKFNTYELLKKIIIEENLGKDIKSVTLNLMENCQ